MMITENTKIKKINLGVLVSGNGTNLQAIIDVIESNRLSATIKIVISDNPDAYALKRAKKHSIDHRVLLFEEFPDRSRYYMEIAKILKDLNVDLVILAGFMRIVSRELIEAFQNRIMNIHPALLPSFPGLHAQRKALKYGVKFSGCTVHFVDEGVDTGPIIIQAIVPVYDEDTEESLSARILKEEHRIYPQAIQLFAEGRLKTEGRCVKVINYEKIPEGVMVNPPIKI